MIKKLFISFRVILVFVSAFLLTDLEWEDNAFNKSSQLCERELEEEDVDKSYDTEVSIDKKVDSSGGGDQFEHPDITVPDRINFQTIPLIHKNESFSKERLSPNNRVKFCILYCSLKICSQL